MKVREGKRGRGRERERGIKKGGYFCRFSIRKEEEWDGRYKGLRNIRTERGRKA